MTMIRQTAPLVAALMALGCAAASAQTLETDDYIYVGFEAEDFVSKDDRWLLTTPSTGTQADDPDGNHSDTASGNQYLEILPDLRVTHEDEIDNDPPSFWGPAGVGPQISYSVTVPQPGRYHVHMRAYSTGTEDNGIHVGLNGDWPLSGRTMQFCTAHLRAWTWGSNQRDAGGNGSCGVQKTIWLDFETAGTHTINLSAREDGFEVDRIALIKDLSNNTRICSPSGATGVNCVNGSIETADGFIDLQATLTTETEGPYAIGDTLTVGGLLENLDGFDTANNVVWTWTLPDGLRANNAPENCTIAGQSITCNTAQLEPTAPEEHDREDVEIVIDAFGEHEVTLAVTADEVDGQPENNNTQITLSTPEPVLDTDAAVMVSTSSTSVALGDSIDVVLGMNTVGDEAAADVSVSLSIPNGWMVGSLPERCSAAASVVCQLGRVDSGLSEFETLTLTPDALGSVSLAASLSAINDTDSSNNDSAVTITVFDPNGDIALAGSGVDGGSTDGASDGTGSGTDDGNSDGSGKGESPGVEPSEDDADAAAISLWWLLVAALLAFSRPGWVTSTRFGRRT